VRKADIKPFEVYGYSEHRTGIYHYSPVMVISTDMYERSRYGERNLVPARPGMQRFQRASFGSGNMYTVGMIMVELADASHDTVRKLRELVSTDAAMEAINSGERNIMDPDDPEKRLGRYGLLTNQRYLHGDYYELTRALEDSRRRDARLREEREQARKAAVAEHEALADRLDKLGLTGYHRASYESPGTTVKVKVGDLEELLRLAELGKGYEDSLGMPV
jgi:hypothetical protein